MISFSQNNFALEEIKISEQIWMKHNLNVAHFKNGEPIEQAETKAEWKKLNEEKEAKRKIVEWNRLKFFEKFLKQNDFGEDFFKKESENFKKLMENFTDKDDWFKEIYEVRVKDILNPVKDINETQDIGQMING